MSTNFTPRPYQLDAIQALADNLAGHRSSLIEMATGLGKTVCICVLCQRTGAKGNRTLILAHRDELIRQAERKLIATGITPSVEKGEQRASLDALVVVASVQSLRGKRLARFPTDHFRLVVVDEAHRSAAPSYRAVFSHFPQAKIVGVTATATRADGVSLGEIYETVAFRYALREAIRDGWLCPLRAQRVEVQGLDLSRIRTKAGDLDADELADAMASAVHATVTPLLELAGDRKTIVFAVDVAHAEALAEKINAARPGAARAVSGETKPADREQALQDFAAGTFQFLVNCALFVEGFDEPSISCVAMCRPTKSLGFYMQCIGRGTRLHPDKADSLILDFVGNAGRHRLISPADCLAGMPLDDDARREVERLLGTGADLEAALEEATAPERAAARHRDEIVSFIATEIDLFLGPDDNDTDAHLNSNPAPPPPELIAKLKKRGVTRLAPSMNREEAQRLLGRLIQRSLSGLCTLKQARQIARAGIDTRNMSFARATELIAMLRINGWKPSAIRAVPEAVAGRAAARRAA